MPKGIYPRCSRPGCTRKQLNNSAFCSNHFRPPSSTKAVKPRKPRKSPNQKVQASRAANPTLEKLIRKIVREEIAKADKMRPDSTGLKVADLMEQILDRKPWTDVPYSYNPSVVSYNSAGGS